MNDGQPVSGGQLIPPKATPSINPEQQSANQFVQTNPFSSLNNQGQAQVTVISQYQQPSYQNRASQPITEAPQLVSSNAEDIILSSNTPKSHKLRNTVIVSFIVLLILFTIGISFHAVINQTNVFKSTTEEYNQQYQFLIEKFLSVIDTQAHEVKWDNLSEINIDSFDSMNTFEESITNSSPILLDSELTRQVKEVVSRTSGIANIAKSDLLYLKTVYDEYISYWLPFINDKSYFGSLPIQEYTINEFSTNDDLLALDDNIRMFSSFMVAYQNSIYSLRTQLDEKGCDDNSSIEECQQIQNLISKIHQTLSLEWLQIKDDIYNATSTIEKYSENDPYGTIEMNNLERRLNG